MQIYHIKKRKIKRKRFTFTILQIEDFQGPKPINNNREIRISDAGIERPRNRLGEIQFLKARKPSGHSAKHVRPRAREELLPLGALQMEPPLAYNTEDLLVRLAIQLRKHQSELVIPQCVVYANHYS